MWGPAAEEEGSQDSRAGRAVGWLGAASRFGSHVARFMSEAWALRKELQHPRPGEVLKLTVIALAATAALIAVVNGLDLLFFKLLSERQLRKWGLLAATA